MAYHLDAKNPTPTVDTSVHEGTYSTHPTVIKCSIVVSDSHTEPEADVVDDDDSGDEERLRVELVGTSMYI